MYDRILNPSSKYTMVATLRRADGFEIVHHVRPCEFIVTTGRVSWPLWTLEWIRPRKGLMRFRR